jgi:hypothetical protein
MSVFSRSAVGQPCSLAHYLKFPIAVWPTIGLRLTDKSHGISTGFSFSGLSRY